MRSETFALFCGIACVSLGLLGLRVNVPDSVVYLAMGVWGVAAWRHWTNPRAYAATLAVLFGVLALMGLIPGASKLVGMTAPQGIDIWLHSGAAFLAAYFALRPELSAEHRAGTPDRREKEVPVERERRHGHADRRMPSATDEI